MHIILEQKTGFGETPWIDQLDYLQYSGICGPTSLCMLGSAALGYYYTPEDLFNDYYERTGTSLTKYYDEGNGYGNGLLKDPVVQELLHIKYEDTYNWGEAWGDKNQEGQLMQALEDGKRVIMATQEELFTTTGHYIVLEAKGDKIWVNDPNGANYPIDEKSLERLLKAEDPLTTGLYYGFDPKFFKGLSGAYYVFSADNTNSVPVDNDTIINDILTKVSGEKETVLLESLKTESSKESKNDEWLWPVDSTSISSDFGLRNIQDEFAGTGQTPSSNHGGVDIGWVSADQIVASRGGTVILSQMNGSAGKEVRIDHGDGYVTRYLHCSSLEVKQGDIVQAGDLIAITGNTGTSSGEHLHFEVQYNGQKIDPLSLPYSNYDIGSTGGATTSSAPTKPTISTKPELPNTTNQNTTDTTTKPTSSTRTRTTTSQSQDISNVNPKWESGHLDYTDGILDWNDGKNQIRETWCPIDVRTSDAIKFTILELGIDEGYWVRDDSVQMFGDKVCIASDIGAWFGDKEGAIFKPGDTVESSMGTGVVMDLCVKAVETRKDNLKNGAGQEIDVWFDIYAMPDPDAGLQSKSYTDSNKYYQSNAGWEDFFDRYPSMKPETPEPVTDWAEYFKDPEGYFKDSNTTTEQTTPTEPITKPVVKPTTPTEPATEPTEETTTPTEPVIKPTTKPTTSTESTTTKPNTDTTTPTTPTRTRTTTKPNTTNPTINPEPSTDEKPTEPTKPIKPTKPSEPSIPSITEPEHTDIPVMQCTPEAVLKAAKNVEITENDIEYICNILHSSGYLTEEEINMYKNWDINEICKLLDERGWDKVTNISDLKNGDIIIVNNGEEIRVYAGNNSWYTAGETEVQQGNENWAENTNWFAYRPD